MSDTRSEIVSSNRLTWHAHRLFVVVLPNEQRDGSMCFVLHVDPRVAVLPKTQQPRMDEQILSSQLALWSQPSLRGSGVDRGCALAGEEVAPRRSLDRNEAEPKSSYEVLRTLPPVTGECRKANRKQRQTAASHVRRFVMAQWSAM